MSMKKAFDQTIRDLKREVNKKVLKVPTVEQKVLDATSNEPWGPHGSLLAEIAQSSRNYHEYHMIMAVIWKRINDTGKNWRHVYKALTVLEYLVAHGSERIIDEIREHAYQISTLSDFQYIDSSGRDQGNNVRRKSQSLVVLVNDKERIQEVRQKAASNRDKFRSTSAVGGMYRPGSGGYGDDRYEGRYGGREDDRYGYGTDKESGYRDDERYGDSYSREGDRYGRDSGEQYGKDIDRDDDSRGRNRNIDDDQYGPRSRSSDRGVGRAYDDDDRHSARGSLRPEHHMQDESAPPSYEEAVGDSRSPTFSERNGEAPAGSAPQSSSPTATVAAAPQSSSPIADAAPQSSSFIPNAEHGEVSHPNINANGFDEFDPRGSAADAPSSSNNAEVDLFGSLSDVFSPNPLAIMPASSGTTDLEADTTASNATFTAATSGSNSLNQSFDDPFGESPFKAISSDGPTAQPQNFAPISSFQPAVNTVEHRKSTTQKVDNATNNVEFTDALAGIDFNSTDIPNAQTLQNHQYSSQDEQFLQDDDILAGILPPSGPLPSSQASFPVSTGTPPATFFATPGMPLAMSSQVAFPSSGAGFVPQSGLSSAPFPQIASQNITSHTYPAQSMAMNSNSGHQAQMGLLSGQNSDFLGDFPPQAGSTISSSSESTTSSAVGPLAIVLQQPSKEKQKFEPKSAVWADTLSRGLVDFNISGPKCNPMSDIGVDFESLNRKDKRMEKPSASAAPATSNVAMGKAMGSGSGIGRAGVGAIRPLSNPTMGPGMGGGMGMGMGGRPGMGMGMGGGPGLGMGMGNGPGMGMGMGMGMSMGGGPGVGMGGYGSMNQPPSGPAMGMGGYGSMNQQPMGMGMNMGGMNMGMGQGVPMQPSNGLAPGSNMGNYNPMMGRGGYPQQPFGGGYQ